MAGTIPYTGGPDHLLHNELRQRRFRDNRVHNRLQLDRLDKLILKIACLNHEENKEPLIEENRLLIIDDPYHDFSDEDNVEVYIPWRLFHTMFPALTLRGFSRPRAVLVLESDGGGDWKPTPYVHTSDRELSSALKTSRTSNRLSLADLTRLFAEA